MSLLRSALTMQSARMIWAEGEALDIFRDMRSGGITGLHPTRDGYLYLSANTPRFWKALCEMTGLTELAANARYDTVRKRAQHAAEIVPKLRAALLTRTAAEWEAAFGDQVPCAMARADRRHVRSSRRCSPRTWSRLSRTRRSAAYRGIAHPIKFGRTPCPAPFAAPTLGQDTDDVLGTSGTGRAERA